MKKRPFWTICLGVWFMVAAGAGLALAQPPKMQVAASIFPLADFCRQIGGERVEVQELIPPGASPHSFEPSPGMLTGLQRSRIVVYIGSGLEPWIDKFLQTLKNPKPLVVSATQGLELIEAVHDHVGPEDSHRRARPRKEGGAHRHGAYNPHVWLDPVLAQDICRRIAAAFMEADPEGRATYEGRLNAYLARLEELDRTIATVTQGFRIREFVGFHPSFSYFARRYHLREVGIIEVAPGREPTPRALKKIVQAIQKYGINVIFSEPQFSSRIAEVLAKEAGVSVLTLDPLGGKPPGDNYLDLMKYNLDTMARAMK